MRKNT